MLLSNTFDIIIPSYGIGHLTKLCLECLESIRYNSREYRIIFIDNGSPDFDSIYPELEKHNHLLVRNTENLGFIKAVNIGLALATASYIVLLNNDTRVVEHWLTKLQEPLLNDADISGPLSTAKDSWQGRVGEAPGYRILPRTNMLAFFCTMFKKEVFDTVGFLDEDFGVGFGDDDWFCHKAVKAGFKLALVTNIRVHHEHRSTFTKLYGADKVLQMQKAALRKYFNKVNEAVTK